MTALVRQGTAPAERAERLLPVATARRVASRLAAALGRRWPHAALTLLTMICGSAVGLAGPIAIGWITQAVVDHARPSALVPALIVLIGCGAAAAGSAWASGALLARTVLPAVGELREEVVASVLAMPLDEVEAGGTGDLVSRVSDDVERVADTAQGAFGSFVTAAITIAATFAGLASVDWRLALAGLLAVPIQLGTLRWYLRASGPVYASGRVADGRRAGALLGAFSALPTIRAFRMRRSEEQRIAAASEGAMESEFAAVRLATRFYGRLNVAELVGLAAILVVAFALVRGQLLDIGSATTAALFFAGLFDPINTVLGVFDQLQQAGAGLARLVGITDAFPAPASRGPAEPPVCAAASARPDALVGEGLVFAYREGAPVVRGVDITVEAGQRVALVGASGSGKSTLASLLAGLRAPDAGTVRYGGASITREQSYGAGSPIAMVAQETHVFAGTIADNIRLAAPELDEERALEILAEAGALAWVERLPQGARTRVGLGGQPLTAQQAQHLALARLLAVEPRIAILDEATAEAGSEAADVLDAAAETVLRGRSALIVAHRLSQAARADLVLVMEQGEIVERGTHRELVELGGVYARLWAAWSRG